MSTYKEQLERTLQRNNWEIILIDTTDDWWVDEFWRIKSSERDKDLELFILFEVDPQFEGPRKKGQGIWLIDALINFPKDRLDKESSVASISMSKRKFNIKLDEFLVDLNNFRGTYIENRLHTTFKH